MKICVIGFPRSRSSLLTESLSDYFCIPIIGEDINLVNKMLENRATWVHDRNYPPKPIGHFNKLKSLLKSVQQQQDGIIRLHPLQLSMAGFSGEVLDFNLFGFDQYDQIYFTDRNSVPDSICSHFISTHITRRFTYQSLKDINQYINPMSIYLDTYGYLCVFLYEKLIEHELKKYLIEKNISWIQLEYNDIPAYIKTNFGDGLSRHVETQYNYKELIGNYSSIERKCNELTDYVTKQFYALNPQFK